jgi:4-amino-4-deoxy-L-arabinose transferase-like glycosyltransferase
LNEPSSSASFISTADPRLTGHRWWLACGLVLLVTLAVTVPTTGDLGLTWDEPVYRFSQERSAAWWRQLGQVRSRADLDALLDSNALIFYWPYGHHGVNFHPPLAGQLNLLTHVLFGRWMKDIPSRRMASVLEYAFTITIGFGFLARRYGTGVGLVMAGSLLFMPRIYGDAHLATTDTPGLFLWAATAVALWKGLYEPNARRWRVLVGILLGLAFVEKMAAVFVLAPLLFWLAVARLPRSLRRDSWKADWIDGLVTSAWMLMPLIVAFSEILRLRAFLREPKQTNLILDHPETNIPGAILAVPLLVWLYRRLFGRLFHHNTILGTERPGLETWTSILAFAPVIGWLGNPAWWRETLPRLAHYYMLNTDRKGSLDPIRIFYLGETYEYSLPWHNGWVLIAVTVPAAILLASALGIIFGLRVVRRDRLPLFFLINLVTIPIIRMLPTPAHDGVRLILPTFFFLAAFAGWGAIWVADVVSSRLPFRMRSAIRAACGLLVLVPSAWQLARIHPYELSYYNELIGGTRGAVRAGFERTYWYDAFNTRAIADINRRMPQNALVYFYNKLAETSTFTELQALGELRSDIRVGGLPHENEVPFAWLLTHDSKAVPFTRLLFAMDPWLTWRVDGLRMATVADPNAVARAYALSLMTDALDDRSVPVSPAPVWVQRYAPFLGRFWGEGVVKVRRHGVDPQALRWASKDPRGFLAAARILAERQEAGAEDDPGARRMLGLLSRQVKQGVLTKTVLRIRPQAIVEAAWILTERPDAVRKVLTRPSYTEPDEIGGPLDQGLPRFDSTPP